MLAGILDVGSHVQSGAVKAYAIGSTERNSALPNVLKGSRAAGVPGITLVCLVCAEGRTAANGDMFNHGLKAKVDGLCSELSQLLAQQPFVPVPPRFQSQSQGGGQQPGGASISLFVSDAPGRASGQWWPAELGMPNGSGGQNLVRYAYFNAAHRLAVELNGHVTVYDSLDHQIGGVSQQQGSGGSLTFTSQYGIISVSTLPVVSVDGVPRDAPAPAPQAEPSHAATAQETDIFAKIERLADLQKKGILSSEEFAAKKAELLSRL
jgi:hypothetical protein